MIIGHLEHFEHIIKIKTIKNMQRFLLRTQNDCGRQMHHIDGDIYFKHGCKFAHYGLMIPEMNLEFPSSSQLHTFSIGFVIHQM